MCCWFASGMCDYTYISNYTELCSIGNSSGAPSAGSGNCEIDVDECASHPCQNGAECSDSTSLTHATPNNTYQCRCGADFQNGMCAYTFIDEVSPSCTVGLIDIIRSRRLEIVIKDVNECSSSPCANGATCEDSTTNTSIPYDTYRCTCIQGYENGRCSYAFIDEYAESAVLSTVSGGFDLGRQLRLGYRRVCQQSVLEQHNCSDSSVSSDVTAHAYRCACVAGFANGVCTDHVGAYSRECAMLKYGWWRQL